MLSSKDFIDALISNMGSGENNKETNKKIAYFFSCVPSHAPDCLIYIEEKIKIHNANTKMFEKELRKKWLEIWDNGFYEENQKKYFLKHYPDMGKKETNNLSVIVAQYNIEELKITEDFDKVAATHEVPQLIKHYQATKKLEVLTNYIDKQDNLTKKDGLLLLQSISMTVKPSFYDYDLFLKIFKKSNLSASDADTDDIYYVKKYLPNAEPRIYQEFFDYLNCDKADKENFRSNFFDFFTPQYYPYGEIPNNRLASSMVRGLLRAYNDIEQGQKPTERDTFNLKKFFNYCDNMSFILNTRAVPELSKMISPLLESGATNQEIPSIILKNYCEENAINEVIKNIIQIREYHFNSPDEIPSFVRLFKSASSAYTDKKLLDNKMIKGEDTPRKLRKI